MKRTFHGNAQIIGRVSHSQKPARVGILGHCDAGQIAIIGARFQRFGPPRCQGKVHWAQVAQIGQAICCQCLNRDGQCCLTATHQNNRQPKPQITAGAGEGFSLGWAQTHALYIGRRFRN
jgi:hypothetical protein